MLFDSTITIIVIFSNVYFCDLIIMSLKTIRLNMFRLLAVLFIFNNKEIQRNFALGKFEGHVLCANTLDIIPPLYD